MIGLIASLLCLLLMWQLFRFNRESDARTSKALWIPTFWLFIAASRNVTEWLQFGGGAGTDQYMEGSPVDRAVLTGVLALGVIVLIGRARRAGDLIRANIPVMLYFLYCGISVLWSDFPDVSFKRWFRALGDVVMVMIVLTDPEWLLALRRLLARIGFVVVPVSVLFIRYFPMMGRLYTRGGSPTWTGVATDKNGLGMISLVFGLASLFRFLEIYREPKETRNKRQMMAQGAIFTMALYLLYEANSATAFSCFFLAVGPMVLTYLYPWARKRAVVNFMVLVVLGIAFSALFLSLGSGMLQGLNRDSTLTGRTTIWHFALGMVQSPLFGTGFESFWLGQRLAQMKVLIDQGVNQAHNGYIEVYLNLGWVGVTLLVIILLIGYRRILASLRTMTQAASLRLAYFIVAVAYNFTEAGFKMMHPVWITFLLAAMVIPEAPREEDPPQFDYLAEYKLRTSRPAVLAGNPYAYRDLPPRASPRNGRG
jgi:O-antigen ligase